MTVPARATVRGLHLFAIFGISVTQPLFDLIARHPGVLVAHSATPATVLSLVALLTIGGPAFAWCIEELAFRANAGLGRALHLGLVGLAAGAAFLPLLKRIPDAPGFALLAAAATIGGLAAFAYARSRLTRTFVTALALGPLLFSATFLADESIEKLLFADTDAPSGASEIAAPAPIVFVVFDELPTTSLLDEAGRIDPIRYPAFAALARDSVWYKNASTVFPMTLGALPPIVSGRYPSGQGLAIASEHRANIFTLLAERYLQNVHEPVTSLHVKTKEMDGAPRGDDRSSALALFFDLGTVYLHILAPEDLLSPLPATWRGFAPEIGEDRKWLNGILSKKNPVADFRRFVASIVPHDRPALHFAHVSLPHHPWRYLPSGRRYLPTSLAGWRLPEFRWTPEPWWVVHGQQRHLLQLEFTDALLGKLLAHLAEIGLYERALIVVTADHGVSFWPDESPRDPAGSRHPEDILGIPLLVKAPHQNEARVNLRNVETIDILPTVAAIIGARIPWPVDGRSVAEDDFAERPQKRLYHDDGSFEPLPPDLALRRESLDRKLAHFGSGRSRPAPGPRGELVGRRVEDFEKVAPAKDRARLARSPFDRAARRPGTLAYARVTGHFLPHRPDEEARLIAIAIRGTIRAVVPAISRDPRKKPGERFISAILSEEELPQREEQVQLFVVGGTRAATVLRPVATRFE